MICRGIFTILNNKPRKYKKDTKQKNSRQSIKNSCRPLPDGISFQNCSKIAIRLAVSGWVLNKEFMNPITPLAKLDG